ncbi:MAG: hypothetical protein H7Y41_02245, partial [Hyphomonadaceae bacterium]|nr:hypothetical protein [Clostridia bacterium]
YVLCVDGQPEQPITLRQSDNGYTYEVSEVMACLRASLLESDKMPLDETLAIMKTMDEVQKVWLTAKR